MVRLGAGHCDEGYHHANSRYITLQDNIVSYPDILHRNSCHSIVVAPMFVYNSCWPNEKQ